MDLQKSRHLSHRTRVRSKKETFARDVHKVTVATPLANVTAQCDSPQMETPLLYCNSISTPLHLAALNSPAHMSGISSLNITGDSDVSHSQLKLPSFMPPPIRFDMVKTKVIVLSHFTFKGQN